MQQFFWSFVDEKESFIIKQKYIIVVLPSFNYNEKYKS